MGHGPPPSAVVPGTAALRPAPFLHAAAAGSGAANAASVDGALLNGSQSRREALNAYYRAQQGAPVENAVPQESSSAPSFTAPLTTHSLASQSSSGSVTYPAAQQVLGLPARRVSLLVPQPRSEAQADPLTPGKPGLRSQLSQMMQEVAQARSEVQEVQSQLSVHSRLGLRSGSTASSLVSSDFVPDIV